MLEPKYMLGETVVVIDSSNTDLTVGTKAVIVDIVQYMNTYTYKCGYDKIALQEGQLCAVKDYSKVV